MSMKLKLLKIKFFLENENRFKQAEYHRKNVCLGYSRPRRVVTNNVYTRLVSSLTYTHLHYLLIMSLFCERLHGKCRVRAKFHYTDPTRTRPDPHGPARTFFAAKLRWVRAGPVGSV